MAYINFDEFPVMAIFIKPSGVRFTQGKTYELTPCKLNQSTNCTVTDDNGVELTFTKDNTYWKLVSDYREEKLNQLLNE